MKLSHAIALLLVVLFAAGTADAARKQPRHPLGLPLYTIETEHFRINYQQGTEGVARRTGVLLEEFYGIYKNTYNLTLPNKTEVLVANDEENLDDFAYPNSNLISIMANDFDFAMRGSGNYLRGTVAHEFAHVVSIWSSLKLPPWMPYVQFGYFSHPNSTPVVGTSKHSSRVGLRADILHIYPGDILPPWFTEGITQFESTRLAGDAWDSHRDMILRTLALNDKLLSWDHMAVFAGKGDDFEKTYNHGFSLMRYIADTYGYPAVVSILRESTKALRVNFDRSIRNVLGISGRQLYREWSHALKVHYRAQLDSLGTQVYGRKLNKEGFENHYPRFSPDGHKIYFVSNGKNDYAWRTMRFYSYNTVDTVKEDKRIKPEALAAQGFYDISDSLGLLAFSSAKSAKSTLPLRLGGYRARDLFIDSLPPAKHIAFRKSRERQVTKRASLLAATFSPTGDRLAAAHHRRDRFYLCILDTAGKDIRAVYPDSADTVNPIQTIYTVDWSADGRHIAFSYVRQTGDRKVGLYDTLEHSFTTVCDTKSDERDPRFSHDGKTLYFASDRSGIFNIYRYGLESGGLQRVTNVAGGAFEPDVSADERQLAYVNYDKNGYGIYLLDSLKTLAETTADNTAAGPPPLARESTGRATFSQPDRYSHMPRQLLLIPTFLGEQILSKEGDYQRGVTSFKLGVVANLLDPVVWAERPGNELGAYFLFDPAVLGDLSHGVRHDYDLGAFGTSTVLPLELSLEYAQRGIAGTGEFFDATSDRMLPFHYSMRPVTLLGRATYDFSRITNAPIALNGVASYNWFKVRIEDINDFDYFPSRGLRLGAYLTLKSRKRDQYTGISPRGLYAKLSYDYRNDLLMDEDDPWRSDGTWFAENYDEYRYHQLTATLKTGIALPGGLRRHHLSLDAWATGLTPAPDARQDMPSYNQPVAWLPGYVYYFRDFTTHTIRDTAGVSYTDTLIADTVLITGNAVARVQFSYRFPLWARSIDRKLGFLYFDHLYGAVNACAAGGWHRSSDVTDTRWGDLLKTVGAEIRLEAVTFGVYPLAISLRWDNGLNKYATSPLTGKDILVGGNRFTLSMLFNFDNWELIDLPDYSRRPAYATPLSQR